MKIYNYLNGIFYTLFGLLGVLIPAKMAELLGFALSLLGQHELRAISMVCAVLGMVLVMKTSKATDQRPLTMIIVLITLGFAAGRFLGLLLDGFGPEQTYYELVFELIWAPLGLFLIRRGS